jgi:hypothetical protein
MVLRSGTALLLFGATLSGCVYSFDNPVATQPSGTVSGQLSLGKAAAGQSLAGAQVSLLWSDVATTADAQGQFSFVDLPPGTYRLNVIVPPPAGSLGQLPIEFTEGQIYLPQTSGGATDALAFGSVQLDTAGVIGGTVVGPGNAGAVVGAFEPDSPDGGVGEYEDYSTTTDSTGAYSLTLPPGQHQLWASTATESATLVQTVLGGQSVQGQTLTLAPPDGGPTADLVGGAVVGNYGADAPAATLQGILLDGGLSVAVEPASGVIGSLVSAYGLPEPAAGVPALQISQELLPGQLYTVTVGPPSFLGTGQLVPAVIPNVPAIAGRATFLQQIFVFSVATVAANGGIADAGPVDAGVADAGPIDAGPVDAGPTLLVDNDGNTPPNGSGDTSLGLFENWLATAGITNYTPYLEPDDGSDITDLVVDGGTLAGIGTIVYFTGSNYVSADTITVSPAQQATLMSWLNAGGHTLLLFSPEIMDDVGVDNWSKSESNPFLVQDVGAQGDLEDPSVWSADAGDTAIQSTTSNVVTGSSSVPAFSGKSWTVTSGVSSSVSCFFSIAAPATGVDVLATIPVDPENSGTANTAEPVVLGHKHVGSAGTSTVVWVGFTIENIDVHGANSLADFFAAVQAYAGPP